MFWGFFFQKFRKSNIYSIFSYRSPLAGWESSFSRHSVYNEGVFKYFLPSPTSHMFARMFPQQQMSDRSASVFWIALGFRFFVCLQTVLVPSVACLLLIIWQRIQNAAVQTIWNVSFTSSALKFFQSDFCCCTCFFFLFFFFCCCFSSAFGRVAAEKGHFFTRKDHKSKCTRKTAYHLNEKYHNSILMRSCRSVSHCVYFRNFNLRHSRTAPSKHPLTNSITDIKKKQWIMRS